MVTLIFVAPRRAPRYTMRMNEAPTSDPIIKLEPDSDTLILELHKIQPRLHKRLTARLRQRQEAYILAETARVFSAVLPEAEALNTPHD